MALSENLVRQVSIARELKKKYLAFYEKREKKYHSILAESLAQAKGNRAQRENVIDWFLHEYRFRTGETMIDKFISVLKPTDIEYQMISNWKNSFEGFFEIKTVDIDEIQAANMFDKIEYTLAFSKDDDLIKTLLPGQFILSRVEPMDAIYLLTGIPHVFPQESEAYVRKIVKDVLEQRPELALRSKDTGIVAMSSHSEVSSE